MVQYDCDDYWHWQRALQGPTHFYSTLLTAPIVLELVYIEFGTDPSPSDC